MSDEDSFDGVAIDKDNADASFLRSITKKHKEFEASATRLGRIINLIEIPLVVLSAINVASIVSTFLSNPEHQFAAKVISMLFTSIMATLVGIKRLGNFDAKRSEFIQNRNQTHKLKLLFIDALNKKDSASMDTIKKEYISLIGNLNE
jgi:L-cystine uptake protein TcyP (sodium:dicarboxylate symporter family)